MVNWLVAMAFLRRSALVAGVAVLVAGCGGDADQDDASRQPVVEDPGPVHVHALGINPSDGALFIATHTGLFRAAEGERRAERVADRFQDTMGFTVVGADRFLGSGHPDGRENLPPFLGLIESADAGATWEPVSLQGDADFHVLEVSGDRVWGFGSDFESRREQLLVSDDGGRTWAEREPPDSLVALALDPANPDRAVAAGQRSLYSTADAGRTWRALRAEPGLLAWPRGNRLFRVDGGGRVATSADAGRTWRTLGEVGGEPAAFEGAGDDLYVALHDGRIVRSGNGGRTWELRLSP